MVDDPLENDGRDTGRNDRSRGQALSGSAGKSGSSPFTPLLPRRPSAQTLGPARTAHTLSIFEQAFATAHTAKPCWLKSEIIAFGL